MASPRDAQGDESRGETEGDGRECGQKDTIPGGILTSSPKWLMMGARKLLGSIYFGLAPVHVNIGFSGVLRGQK